MPLWWPRPSKIRSARIAATARFPWLFEVQMPVPQAVEAVCERRLVPDLACDVERTPVLVAAQLVVPLAPERS